jgi:hypothetical protein
MEIKQLCPKQKISRIHHYTDDNLMESNFPFTVYLFHPGFMGEIKHVKQVSWDKLETTVEIVMMADAINSTSRLKLYGVKKMEIAFDFVRLHFNKDKEDD